MKRCEGKPITGVRFARALLRGFGEGQPLRQQADETITARSRVLLIHMAEAWLRLADKAEKNLTTDLVYGTPERSAPQQVQPEKDG